MNQLPSWTSSDSYLTVKVWNILQATHLFKWRRSQRRSSETSSLPLCPVAGQWDNTVYFCRRSGIWGKKSISSCCGVAAEAAQQETVAAAPSAVWMQCFLSLTTALFHLIYSCLFRGKVNAKCRLIFLLQLLQVLCNRWNRAKQPLCQHRGSKRSLSFLL